MERCYCVGNPGVDADALSPYTGTCGTYLLSPLLSSLLSSLSLSLSLVLSRPGSRHDVHLCSILFFIHGVCCVRVQPPRTTMGRIQNVVSSVALVPRMKRPRTRARGGIPRHAPTLVLGGCMANHSGAHKNKRWRNVVSLNDLSNV